MNLLTKLATVLLLSAALPGVVNAKATTIATAGSWQAFKTVGDDTGVPICGMMTLGDGGRILMVKYGYGDKNLSIHVQKKSWRIPQELEMNMAVGFDKVPLAWTATVTAHKSGNAVFMFIKQAEVANFLREFRNAVKMHVSFLSGSEPRWTADMEGSDTITDAFNLCVKNMQAPSQPFDNKPSQPFSSSPTQPTQPFERKSLPSGTRREDI